MVIECYTCKNHLTIEDKFEGSNRYPRNCRTCQGEQAGSKRKRRVSSTSSSIVATTEMTKKKRNTGYNSDAFRQSSSLFSSETQQPVGTLGPEHTPSPDTVPLMQSTTTSDSQEHSGESGVGVVRRKPRLTFGRSRSQKPLSQASQGSSTSKYRRIFSQAFRNNFQKKTKRNKGAKINNKHAPGRSPRIVLKLPKKKVCSVCAETLPWQRFPRLADCEHDPEVCDECFLLWLKQQMENVTSILCPSSGCSHIITHEEVGENTPQDVFTRFDELSMRSLLSADRNFLYCHAEGCSSGQIHDTGMEGPIFCCAACGYRICTAHDPIIPFHENEACTQYNARVAREIAQAKEEERVKTQEEEEARVRRKQEAASAVEVARSSVECPGCGVQIQKTAGCDHMTCRRYGCRFQFCYVCRAPYKGADGILTIGNSAHASTCRYHSSRLPDWEDPDDENSDEGDSNDEDEDSDAEDSGDEGSGDEDSDDEDSDEEGSDDEDTDDEDVIDLDVDDETLRAAIRKSYKSGRPDLSYG